MSGLFSPSKTPIAAQLADESHDSGRLSIDRYLDNVDDKIGLKSQRVRTRAKNTV